MKTLDGGNNWSTLASGTTDWLTVIDVIDANTAYVTGENGTILKTEDGGLTWKYL